MFRQDSKSKCVAAMELTAAVMGSWLSTAPLDSLVLMGEERACIDSAAAASRGFLLDGTFHSALGNALSLLLFLLLVWHLSWLCGSLFRSR